MTDVAQAITREPPRLQYPPLPLWKLALLMAATFTLYYFFWFYRAARDLRDEAGQATSPWLWALAPLLGPLSAIPCWRMSEMINRWADAEGVRRVGVNAPWLVAAIMFFSQVLSTVSDGLGFSLWWLFAGLAGVVVPFLFMQAQLNLIKADKAAAAFRTPPMRYTGLQIAAIVVCVAIIGWIAAIFVWDLNRRGPAQKMAAGTVFEDTAKGYRLEIRTDGWSQIEPGYSSDESELEFVSDYPDDWGLLFVSVDSDLDRHTEDRVEWIRDSFAKARCSERRSLTDGGATVVGTLDCSGRDALYGHYQYRSRVVVNDEDAMEVLLFIADENKDRFEQRQRLLELADGLSLP